MMSLAVAVQLKPAPEALVTSLTLMWRLFLMLLLFMKIQRVKVGQLSATLKTLKRHENAMSQLHVQGQSILGAKALVTLMARHLLGGFRLKA